MKQSVTKFRVKENQTRLARCCNFYMHERSIVLKMNTFPSRDAHRMSAIIHLFATETYVSKRVLDSFIWHMATVKSKFPQHYF